MVVEDSSGSGRLWRQGQRLVMVIRGWVMGWWTRNGWAVQVNVRDWGEGEVFEEREVYM